MPLHITTTFIAAAIVLGFFAGRDVASASLIDLPRSLDDGLRAFEPEGAAVTVTNPASGWVAAGSFVEMDDDDRLTAGRLAWITGAGPLVTSVLALVLAFY